jgi:hypothetical protein
VGNPYTGLNTGNCISVKKGWQVPKVQHYTCLKPKDNFRDQSLSHVKFWPPDYLIREQAMRRAAQTILGFN